MQAQLTLKNHVEGIEAITVNKALGYYGMDQAIVMTIDLKDKDAWNNLLADPYHTKLGEEGDQYFDMTSCVDAQVEV
ncbi:MAG: Dabb family protein [Aerococcus sp.]|nr:Dabb family protein [Aerococcus sp.]